MGVKPATQRPAAPAATIPSLREAALPAPPGTTTAPRQAAATTSVPVRPTPELPGSTAKNPPQAHSLSGLIGKVESDGPLVRTSNGQEWRVTAGHGTLIKLGGKPAGLDALRPDDRVVVLGIAEGEEHFQATAVTARRGR
jgi:hypothetical protein